MMVYREIVKIVKSANTHNKVWVMWTNNKALDIKNHKCDLWTIFMLQRGES